MGIKRHIRSEEMGQRGEHEESMIDGIEYPACGLRCAVGQVYALYGRGGNIFYVGCTTRPLKQRLLRHLNDARSVNIKTSVNKEKVDEIRRLNFKVKIKLLGTTWVTAPSYTFLASRMREFEKKWILKIVCKGHRLTNASIRRLYPPQFLKQPA